MRPRVARLCYQLHEPLFHASRELGTQYLSEPVLSAYGQPYALGWVTAPYRLEGDQAHTPRYVADLTPLNQQGFYLTPAGPGAVLKLRTERFNAQGEGWRSRMDQGAVVDDMEILLTPGGKGRAVNRPQQGSIRFVDRGSELISYLIYSGERPPLPEWVRLGKTLARARLSVEELPVLEASAGVFQSMALLNPVDLPPSVRALRFDLIGVRPVPILRDATLNGAFLRTAAGCLPTDMAWRFPS